MFLSLGVRRFFYQPIQKPGPLAPSDVSQNRTIFVTVLTRLKAFELLPWV